MSRRYGGEIELRLAPIMRAERLFERMRPLELGALALRAGELDAKCFELVPADTLVADRAIAVGAVLKVAAEVLDHAHFQTCQEAITDARYQLGLKLGVRRKLASAEASSLRS